MKEFGACDDRDVCDLYFTVVDSASTVGHTATHVLSTYMVTDQSCRRGLGCLGEYTLAVKSTMELTYDAEHRRAVGRVDVSLGNRLPRRPNFIRLTHIGHSEFEATTSNRSVSTYDSGGMWISSYDTTPSIVSRTVLRATCENFVDSMVELAADGVAGGVAYGIHSALMYAVSELAASAFFVHPVAGVGTFVVGSAIAGGTSTIALLATRSFLKALAQEYNVEDICDTIEPGDGDDGDGGDVGLPDGDHDIFDPDELERLGCLLCTEWGYEDLSYSYIDADGMENVVIEEGEFACLSWQVDPSGTDDNGDGWCDN